MTIDFFVLNVCSGHRRAGEVQDLASTINWPVGFRVWFISVDIVSGNPSRNLADSIAFDSIISHPSAHPWVDDWSPCQTWTAIRFLEMIGGKGPRPLRSARSPWSLPDLSRREYAQLSIGNSLLRCALSLAFESLCTGLSGVIEHPDGPENVDYPSIWLEIMKRLDQHEKAHSFSFTQGPLGQVSPKPTRFLAVNLSKCSEYIR